MELSFELTAEDLDAFYRHANASAWGLLIFEWGLVVLGLLVVDYFFFRKEPVIGIVVNAAGIGLYIAKKWRTRHVLHDRNVRSLVEGRSSLIGSHRLKITPEGYEHEVGPARVMWRWKQVTRVMETEEHFFLRVGMAGATIIPKRAFSDPTQLTWFRNALPVTGRS